MHLRLEHPAGFDAEVVYDGDLWMEGAIGTTPTMGGTGAVDGRMWYFSVTVEGDHGTRERRAVSGGWAVLIREDGEKHVVGYTAPELTDLSDGTVLILSSGKSTIEDFLIGD